MPFEPQLKHDFIRFDLTKYALHDRDTPVFRPILCGPGVIDRWDEKAGLPRDAIRSQCSTCSKHNEKETGDEED